MRRSYRPRYRVGPCPSCSPCAPTTPRLSSSSSSRTAPTSPRRSPTAAMRTSPASPSGTALCWPSRMPESAPSTCWSLDDGSVLGRFNLVFTEDGAATLGYRVAEHVAGRGVATATVGDMCVLAASRHRLRTVRAATSLDNVASRKVLEKAGFVAVGPADPADIGGKPGTWYRRDLTAD